MTKQQSKARALALQRRRRQGVKRIDYQPSAQVLALITPELRPYVGGDYSSVIDRLILKAAGVAPESPHTSRRCAPATELGAATAEDAIGRPLRAGAHDFDESANEAKDWRQVPTGARDSEPLPTWAPGHLARCATRDANKRVPCGGRRRSDGKPCEALSVPGKRRCKWHGGYSTGPRTAEGKAKVAANLRKRR